MTSCTTLALTENQNDNEAARLWLDWSDDVKQQAVNYYRAMLAHRQAQQSQMSEASIPSPTPIQRQTSPPVSEPRSETNHLVHPQPTYVLPQGWLADNTHSISQHRDMRSEPASQAATPRGWTTSSSPNPASRGGYPPNVPNPASTSGASAAPQNSFASSATGYASHAMDVTDDDEPLPFLEGTVRDISHPKM